MATWGAHPRNVYAFTEPNADYPGFISINLTSEEDADGGVLKRDGKAEITVRSPKKADGGCGDQASVVLGRAELLELHTALLSLFVPTGKA